MRHVPGLDMWRFIAVLWVAFSHGAGPPVKQVLGADTEVARIVGGVSGLVFDGASAVTVFFVISGFCIHFPQVGKHWFDVRAHLVRRYVRIGVPLLATVILFSFMDQRLMAAADSVRWSLYCELIYYSIYPALFAVFRRFGIGRVTIASFLIAAGLVVANWQFLYAWQFGVGLAWIVGLPAWLLGCLLAERSRRGIAAALPGSIWVWRILAWGFASTCGLLVFHGPIKIGYTITGQLFSIVVYLWLGSELIAYRGGAIAALLDAAGRWSYSVYLLHNSVIAAFREFQPAQGQIATWVLQLVAILAASYAFYRAVEYPSHRLARYLSALASTRITKSLPGSQGST